MDESRRSRDHAGPEPDGDVPDGKDVREDDEEAAHWIFGDGRSILLIIVGELIFIEPRILVWLAGTALVFIGVTLLMMARFMRRFGTSSTL